MEDYLFASKRLGFRRFQPGDIPALLAHHQEACLSRWIPNERYASSAEAEEAAAFFGACFDEGALPFVLAVVQKSDGALVGDAGLNEAPGGTEIGYAVSERYSGHGYATEAVQALTAYAARRFGIHTLYGRVLHGNQASCRVLEKAGYVFLHEEADAEDDPYGQGMLVYRHEEDA